MAAATHPPPTGLILAAGFGSRLGFDMPKCLIPWQGATILDHQLDRLASAGVRDVWVVVGFQHDRVRAHIRDRAAGIREPDRPRIHFVENARYMDTNTAKSMALGFQAMAADAARTGSAAAGTFTLNGDVVFDPGILELLADRPGTTTLAVDPRVCGDEEIKYRIRDGRLQALNKQTHGEGEAVGINFMAAADRPLLLRALEYCEDQAYFERAVEFMLPFTATPVRCVPIGDRRAVEIDFPEDLEAARRLFA